MGRLGHSGGQQRPKLELSWQVVPEPPGSGTGPRQAGWQPAGCQPGRGAATSHTVVGPAAATPLLCMQPPRSHPAHQSQPCQPPPGSWLRVPGFWRLGAGCDLGGSGLAPCPGLGWARARAAVRRDAEMTSIACPISHALAPALLQSRGSLAAPFFPRNNKTRKHSNSQPHSLTH